MESVSYETESQHPSDTSVEDMHAGRIHFYTQKKTLWNLKTAFVGSVTELPVLLFFLVFTGYIDYFYISYLKRFFIFILFF